MKSKRTFEDINILLGLVIFAGTMLTLAFLIHWLVGMVALATFGLVWASAAKEFKADREREEEEP